MHDSKSKFILIDCDKTVCIFLVGLIATIRRREKRQLSNTVANKKSIFSEKSIMTANNVSKLAKHFSLVELRLSNGDRKAKG
jgi:hypothetical protein